MAVVPPPGAGAQNAGFPLDLPLPEWMVLGGALLVLGFAAEALYKVSPSAAYMFVFVLLVGYAAGGGRYVAVEKFIAQIQGRGPGIGTPA